ncbi:MAG: biopolymer transporter ExbD [Candidatus Eisenbacteria bacterium]|nr:biopolymer transporter ExbD [Candidatus Eisenbacteria bacterium]
MRRGGKKQHEMELLSDINVTNLVDVTMTLLIIFIMIAPMIEQGIDVTLPTADPKRIDVGEVMTVAVTENGRVYLEGQRVSLDELKERLTDIHTARPDVPVLLKGDTELNYGRVVEVMDAVRSVGISRLALATRPPR